MVGGSETYLCKEFTTSLSLSSLPSLFSLRNSMPGNLKEIPPLRKTTSFIHCHYQWPVNCWPRVSTGCRKFSRWGVHSPGPSGGFPLGLSVLFWFQPSYFHIARFFCFQHIEDSGTAGMRKLTLSRGEQRWDPGDGSSLPSFSHLLNFLKIQKNL